VGAWVKACAPYSQREFTMRASEYKEIARAEVSNRETLQPILGAIEDSVRKGIKPLVVVSIKKKEAK
jgi:hypothetical protein